MCLRQDRTVTPEKPSEDQCFEIRTKPSELHSIIKLVLALSSHAALKGSQ
jgi:hypothetical protein